MSLKSTAMVIIMSWKERCDQTLGRSDSPFMTCILVYFLFEQCSSELGRQNYFFKQNFWQQARLVKLCSDFCVFGTTAGGLLPNQNVYCQSICLPGNLSCSSSHTKSEVN